MEEKSRRTSALWKAPGAVSPNLEVSNELLADGAGVAGGVDAGVEVLRGGDAVQQSAEQAWPYRLGKHMGDAVQVGFLFPFRLLALGDDDEGAFGIMPANFLEHPHAFDAVHLQVEEANLNQAVSQ